MKILIALCIGFFLFGAYILDRLNNNLILSVDDEEDDSTRTCSITGEEMAEGFVYNDEYFKYEKDLLKQLRIDIPDFNADINIGISEYDGAGGFADGTISSDVTDEDLLQFSYDNGYHYWTEWEE